MPEVKNGLNYGLNNQEVEVVFDQPKVDQRALYYLLRLRLLMLTDVSSNSFMHLRF